MKQETAQLVLIHRYVVEVLRSFFGLYTLLSASTKAVAHIISNEFQNS